MKSNKYFMSIFTEFLMKFSFMCLVHETMAAPGKQWRMALRSDASSSEPSVRLQKLAVTKRADNWPKNKA